MCACCIHVRALAAGLPRQDHIWITTEQLIRFHKKDLDEMLCKLNSSELTDSELGLEFVSKLCYNMLSSGFFLFLSRFPSLSLSVVCVCVSLSLSLASTPGSFVHCVLGVRVWVWPGVGYWVTITPGHTLCHKPSVWSVECFDLISRSLSVSWLLRQDTWVLVLIYFFDRKLNYFWRLSEEMIFFLESLCHKPSVWSVEIFL